MLASRAQLLENISLYLLMGFVVVSPAVAIWASEGMRVGLRVAAALACFFMAFSVLLTGCTAIDNALADSQLASQGLRAADQR
jgi:hypothetical protein